MVFVPYMAHTSSNVAYRTFYSHIYVLNIMIFWILFVSRFKLEIL